MRIRLIRTSDPYTKLRSGDEGTVTSVKRTGIEHQVVNVKWDSGSTLSLIEGEDVYKFLSEKTTNDNP